MPIIDTPAGTLEVTNAILSASEFKGTQKISVSNSAPTKNFSVGDKFHVSTTDLDAVNITGNLVAQKLKIGNLLVSPTFDLAAVSNVGNTTSNTLQFANATTGFTTTSNVEIGGNITLTSNAQVKVGSNVLAEYTGPHGREPKEMPLKKYPEIAFDASKLDGNDTTNTYTQAGYTVTSSTDNFHETGFFSYKLFDSRPTKTFVVTVQQVGGANKYFIDGVDRPTLQLYQDQTYIFDLSSSTLLTHPFIFSTSASGSAYTTGITTTGVYGSTEKRTFVVPIGAPTTLYYFCTAHSGMGATASISPTVGWISESDPATVSGSPFNSINSSYVGEWVKLELPKSIKLNHFTISSRKGFQGQFQPENYKLFGSINDSTWVELAEVTGQIFPLSDATVTTNVTTSNYYKYYALVVSKTNSGAVSISEWELYGAEEPAPPGDLSLDTTLKSTFNSVRSNNYVMYFDGEDPQGSPVVPKNLVNDSSISITPHNAVFDATNNCWTLNGSTESNVTTGSLGFEGDVPHTVSTWINASNLEANALTQQLFSIGSGYDKAFLKVDDTQIAANTWHNVTYAYQGEAGSKVTYVDGRKVEEAQVEDTFGDYPPFPMTDYKTAGYCVSASGAYSADANWQPYKAFNDITAAASYLSEGGSSQNYYNDGSGGYSKNPPANLGVLASTGATINQGEFLKIEMPHKLIVNYITQIADSDRAKDFKWYGSNDDHNWIQLMSVVDAPNTANEESFVTTTKDAFKYFAIVVSKVYTTGVYQYFRLDNIKLYGHKEGDLTRFPEPTRVLEYPHVTMTGPAKRGYMVTTNSELAESTAAWKAFDGNDGVHWQTANGSFGTSSPFSAVSGQTFAGYTGHWIKLELPHKIELTRFKIKQFNHANQQPKDYVLLGSNNDSTWTLIHAETAANMPGGAGNGTEDVTSFSAGTPAAYKYIKLLVQKLEGSSGSSAGYMTIDEIEYFGTEEDTGTPAIVGGPFAGKVANFRVYDQYLGDERIQEIYDAQKDEFGHKKSSMTFYKGRVGVGTTEPEGALTVLDEPHTLAKFPVGAVSSNDSYVEGDGQIKLSAADGSGYQAFDGLTSTSWVSTPTRNTRLSEEVDFGAWLKIQTPESMSLKKADIESKSIWNHVGSDIDGTTANESFGRAVACNHDGTRIIVGAKSFNSDQGKVIVYDWNGTAWTQVGNVLTGVASNAPQFGHSVAISGDGNIVAIAAPYEHHATGNVADVGSVRVYYLVGATWTILPDSGTLTAGASSGMSDVFVGESADDHLGYGGVKLSYDGKTIVMGELEDDTGFSDAGRVKVYTYANGTWSQKGSSLTGGATNERFGSRISMSEDGNHLVLATDDGGSSGSNPYVKVYEYGGSDWAQKGSTLNFAGNEGWQAVDISNDGSVVAIGHKNADAADGALNDDNGVVRVYHYESSAWVLKATLNDIESSDDQFGGAVVISGDGKRIIVSAAQWSNGSANYTGRLFTFEYNGSSWLLRQPTPVDATAAVGAIGGVGNGSSNNGHLGYGHSDSYGLAISRDGSTIVGGEIGYTTAAGGNSGRARVFSMPSTIKSIWGSNDDVNWTKIVSGPTREEATSNVAGLTFGYDDRLEFKNLDNPNYYKYHAIIADAFTQLKEVKLYGIRNRGSSTLHDGTLTLTKNLIVGGELQVTGKSPFGLQAITDSGPGANVTSNTVQFTNATTSLVASGNVDVSGNVAIGSSDLTKKLTVGGPMRITDGLSNVCDLSITATPATLAYSQEAKLLPVTSAAQAASGQFGRGVEISADGTYLVVGSPYSTNSAGLGNGGCVHVFKKSGSTWTNVGGAIEAPSNKYNTGFGVSISDDGLRVCAGCEYSQSAYVWDYSGGTWTRTTLATSEGSQYGWAISMSGDGKKIVVGQPGSTLIKSYTNSTSPGTASAWSSTNQINGPHGGRYGSFVKISKDGNTLAVGAYSANKVYTYKWNGSSWGASGYDTFSGSNSFGWCLDINSDGTVLVVGQGSPGGTAYIYEGNGAYGGWGSGTAISPNPGSNTFGRACAINGDGTSVIVGGTNGGTAGGVHVFKKESGSWVQKEIFTSSDATSTGDFGSFSDRVDIMAMASDGTLAVGHPDNSPAGAVYVFNGPNAGGTTLNTSIPIKANGTILSFTGQHICVPSEPMTQGLVVSANKNKYFNLNGVLTTGVGAIRSSESIPMVSLSNVANDRSVFGVVDGIESGISTIRKNTLGPIMVTSEKEMGDNRVIVNSIGEGAIQVVDTNGPLVSGDYMTTSNITGYAQKQDSEFLANYTVAKITMDCDFNPDDVPIQVIKKKDNGENDVDKNGFIQWEDHPTRTQKAYNIGYLAADGTHIIPDTDGTYDEANVVYRTAYVGCTYHCG